MNIKCLLAGHKWTHSTLKNALPIYYQNFTGLTSSVEISGWLHFGEVSNCDRCVKEIEVEDGEYPLIYPPLALALNG